MIQRAEVYIVVLNWNQYALTVDCVRSLLSLDYPEYRVVVVDNGSEDGSVAKLRAEFGDRTEIIANETNLGFAGGSNVGIAYALERGAGYVMLLNNDTVVDPNFLSPLVDVLRSENPVGAVTPKIYFMHDPQRLWAAGGEIRWWLGQARSRGRTQLDHGQFDHAGPVDYATGCCLLFTRAALEEVGLLDERYFGYFEDADWSIRARRAGFQIWYEPTSKIWHVAGGSIRQKETPAKGGQTSPFHHYLVTRNNLWLLFGHAKGMMRLVGLVVFCVRRLLVYSLAFVVLRRWDKLRCLWKGARDGWRNMNRRQARLSVTNDTCGMQVK